MPTTEPQGDSGETMNMSPHTVNCYRLHTETQYVAQNIVHMKIKALPSVSGWNEPTVYIKCVSAQL